MAGPARIHIIKDDQNAIAVIRVTGRRVKDQPPLIDQILRLEKSECYDCILDLHRYETNISLTYLTEVNRRWRQSFANHLFEPAMAVVSDDYNLIGYMRIWLQSHPRAALAIFDGFDEALDWVKSRRRDVDMPSKAC
jgi:hypothetical protein